MFTYYDTFVMQVKYRKKVGNFRTFSNAHVIHYRGGMWLSSRVCQCAKSYQMHAPLCMLMHLVINDSEKQIKSYFLHFSIWSKHVEVYVVRVCSDRFWKKSVHLKIALDMVQMIWTFDIFMTKLQNCKNNLVQNSDTRGTMIFNCLKMVILRPLEIIVPWCQNSKLNQFCIFEI